jgi:ribonuclease Z
MCLNHRSEPLDIYGPPDAKEIVAQALSLGYFTLRFPIEVHALAPGESVELDGYTVRTSHAEHPVPSLAYRIEEGPKRGHFDAVLAHSLGIRGSDFRRLEAGEAVRVDEHVVHPSDVMGEPRPGRSIVYSGDTGPSEDVRRLAHRATVLIHEATVAQEIEAEANEWGHSSARQAAELATSAEVKALFLTHFSSRYKELEPLENEAKVVFPGSRVARDLLDELVRSS